MQMQQTAIPNPKIIEYSLKQLEFQKACNDNPLLDHRYYGKIGATRCGKTTLDFMWTIPFRLSCRKGLQGLNVITGVSLGTIGRNILEPMRKYWNSLGYNKVIGETKKDRDGNMYCMIFGEKVYLVGMEKVTAVGKLRGAEFKYCYCDELAECNEEAFILMKSRLSLPYSCCDFTCNPESDTHWLYFFINSDIDIYIQNYTIFDNPFLNPKFVDNLCKEYAGTVYYDRYILGLWKKAEGLIYKKLANNTKEYILYEIPKMLKINIGVDFGGNGSYHTFVATGVGLSHEFLVHLEGKRIEGTTTPDELEKAFIEFVKVIVDKYTKYILNPSINVFCDSAEQVLIRGLKIASQRAKLPISIHNAYKMEIKQRINLQTKLIGQNRLFFMHTAQTCINAYTTAVYNSKQGHEDERLDDGTSDIDTMDASEYSIEPEFKLLMNVLETRNNISQSQRRL